MATIAQKDKNVATAMQACLKIDTYKKSKVHKTVIHSLTKDSGLTKPQLKQLFG